MERRTWRSSLLIDLPADVVDVWESPLDIPEEHVTQLYDMLSLGEQTRAKAFIDARGYRQYVISVRAVPHRSLNVVSP